jgi:sodium/hydrogen antiporter
VREFYIALAAVGLLVLVLGLLSSTLKKTIFAVPLLALLAGVAMGPAALGLLDPAAWELDTDLLLEEAARASMAIALMGVALRLPPRFLFRQWRSMAVLLGLVMPVMWLASALLSYGLLGTGFLLALLIGAVVTPTDPIVATAIVTGDVAERNIPEPVRHAISGESGANDGLAYPLVMLPALLLTLPAGEAWSRWLLQDLFVSVGAGLLYGVLLGLGAGYLLRKAEAKSMIDRHSFLAYTVALSLLTLAGGELLGVNGVLAVFAAGVAFDQMVGGHERAEEENVQEAFNQFFTLPIFVLFGLMLPWPAWFALGWNALLLPLAILLLRRLPALLLLRSAVPVLPQGRDAAYAGWFGPIGVAALLYASAAKTLTGEDLVWTVGSLVVFASVLVHGMSASPLTRFYGRRRRCD